jgi:hypothetical protein
MNSVVTKVCNGCHQTLPVTAFNRSNGAKYPRSKCKACERALDAVRRKLKEQAEPPPADYHCPICLRDYDQIKGRGGTKSGAWCLDHDHTTHKFRAWLCHDCNRGLGFLGDNADRCRRAADYLSKDSEIHVDNTDK